MLGKDLPVFLCHDDQCYGRYLSAYPHAGMIFVGII